jgi:hypothetical protein
VADGGRGAPRGEAEEAEGNAGGGSAQTRVADGADDGARLRMGGSDGGSIAHGAQSGCPRGEWAAGPAGEHARHGRAGGREKRRRQSMRITTTTTTLVMGTSCMIDDR